MFVVLIILISKWFNSRKMKTHHICIIVTADKCVRVETYKKIGGRIIIPPEKISEAERSKGGYYFYNREYSLNTSYPLLAKFPFSLAQVDAKVSIYDEGDPSPIMPNNNIPMQTSQIVKMITKADVIDKAFGAMDRQFGDQGSLGFNLGKYKLMIQIAIVVLGACILIAGWAGFQVIQFIPYAQQYMSLR
jgi:hypothetical protein